MNPDEMKHFVASICAMADPQHEGNGCCQPGDLRHALELGLSEVQGSDPWLVTELLQMAAKSRVQSDNSTEQLIDLKLFAAAAVEMFACRYITGTWQLEGPNDSIEVACLDEIFPKRNAKMPDATVHVQPVL